MILIIASISVLNKTKKIKNERNLLFLGKLLFLHLFEIPTGGGNTHLFYIVGGFGGEFSGTIVFEAGVYVFESILFKVDEISYIFDKSRHIGQNEGNSDNYEQIFFISFEES